MLLSRLRLEMAYRRSCKLVEGTCYLQEIFFLVLVCSCLHIHLFASIFPIPHFFANKHSNLYHGWIFYSSPPSTRRKDDLSMSLLAKCPQGMLQDRWHVFFPHGVRYELRDHLPMVFGVKPKVDIVGVHQHARLHTLR